ncbi:MAG: PH domain-containing protein [Actinomycetota bacterium]|nr:PH domain-containing protein [Actinomycetota bacterium]
MPFPEELLSEDEEVILDLRPHWWYITPSGIGLGAALLLGLVSLANDWPSPVKVLAALVILVALGYFALNYARWATTSFVVTTQRLVFRSGLVTKSSVEMPLDKINTVTSNQNIFERVIGAGDLVIESASDQDQLFTDVRKPDAVQHEINRQRDRADRRHRDGYSSGPPAMHQPTPPPESESIPDQIERLAQLRDRGIISETDFQAKKADLLNRM